MVMGEKDKRGFVGLEGNHLSQGREGAWEEAALNQSFSVHVGLSSAMELFPPGCDEKHPPFHPSQHPPASTYHPAFTSPAPLFSSPNHSRSFSNSSYTRPRGLRIFKLMKSWMPLILYVLTSLAFVVAITLYKSELFQCPSRQAPIPPPNFRMLKLISSP